MIVLTHKHRHTNAREIYGMENILLHKSAILDSKIQLPRGYVSFEQGGGKNAACLNRPSGEKGEMAPPHLQSIVYSVSN